MVLVAGVAAVGYAALWLAPHQLFSADAPDTALLLVDPQYIRPERVDGLVYFYLVFALGAVAAIQAVLQHRAQSDRIEIAPTAVALAVVSAAVVLQQLSADTLLKAAPIFLIVAVALFWIVQRGSVSQRTLSRSFGAFVLIAVVATFVYKPFAADSLLYAVHSAHYEPVVYAVVLSTYGATCLVDYFPQYGCYGELLAPLFRLVSLSTWSVTLILAVLQCVSIVIILYFARGIETAEGDEKSHLLARLFTFAALLHCLLLNVVSPFDPYFQYMPIRLLMPALALLFIQRIVATSEQNGPGAWLVTGLAGVFAAVAVLWNLDTGLAVAGTLAATCCLSGFSGWRRPLMKSIIVRRLGHSALFAFAFLAATELALYLLALKSGQSVDVNNYFLHVSTFARLGFALLPAPGPISYWGIAAAIVFSVGTIAASKLASTDRRRDKALEGAAFLAVLAMLLLVYYTGRSHDLVLKLASWPLLVLSGFLILRALLESPVQGVRKVMTGVVAGAVALSLALLPSHIAALDRVSWIFASKPDRESTLDDEISFVSSHAMPGEVVEILALHQGMLYSETNTQPATGGVSVTEMYLRESLDDKLRRVVDCGPQKLFLGTDLNGSPGIIPRISIDQAALREVYEPVANSALGRLQLWQRRTEVPFAQTADRWHACRNLAG